MGPCPPLDLEVEKRVQGFLLEIIRRGLVQSAQDISEGGLCIALAECCLNSGEIGAKIELPETLTPGIELFSEDPSRAVISCRSDVTKDILDLASKMNITAKTIGKTGGEHFTIKNLFEMKLQTLREAYESPPF